jgi:predicted glycosyltransferase
MSIERRVSRVAVSTSERLRVALYSHDTCGLGHFRRNLVIARALRAHLGANVLLLSGIREAGSFPVEKGIDTLHLPALTKIDNLNYRPRRLEVGLERLVRLRSETLYAALMAFRPDAFIVDNVPRGAVGELEKSLRTLRSGGHTYTVLGLRDVLDAPENVQREWLKPENLAAIRDLYDSVWVYGDPQVYDVANEYDFPEDIRRSIRFTGYLHPLADREPLDSTLVRAGEEPDICVVGGGHDGEELATVFADACAVDHRPGMVLSGPFMGESATRRLAEHPEISVRRFVPDPIPLYHGARSIVSMGGYNTVMELIALGQRALIVPRVSPRQEQLVRATALSERGLVDLLHPDELSPERIADWLRAEHQTHAGAPASLNMDGLSAIVQNLRHLVDRYQADTALAG